MKKSTWMKGKIKIRSVGDPLLPDGMLNKTFLNKMKRKSKHYYNALYQGSPTDAEGSYFQEEYFKYYKVLPKIRQYGIISIDAAQEVKRSSDFSVLQYWMESEKGYYLVDTLRKKWKFPQLESNAIQFYEKHKPNLVLIETKSNGAALYDNLKHRTKIPLKPVDPKFMKLSKEERVNQILGQFETGNILLPFEATWLWDLKNEMLDFNNGEHDDQVDALAHAIYYLVNCRKNNVRIRSLG